MKKLPLLVDLAVSGRVLGANAVAGRLAVIGRLVQFGTFHQVVNVAVVGAHVQQGVPQLRRRVSLPKTKKMN